MSSVSKKIPIGLVALLAAGLCFPEMQVHAQIYIHASYDYSIPSDGTRDYIKQGSVRGGSFELGYRFSNRISGGLKAGTHAFYEALEKDTYIEDNLTIYGKQFRYLTSFPAMVLFRFNLTDRESRIIPYLRMGAGACYVQKRTDIGLYTLLADNQWVFGLQPEAGLLIPLGRTIGISTGASYNQTFGNRSIGDQQYFGIHLGLMVRNLGRQ